MALSKRGKVWWISYTANGKRVQKPIGMKKKAARYAELELVPILFEDLADKFFEPYPASPHRPRFPGSILTIPAKGKRKQPLNKKIGKLGEPFQDVRTSFENACTRAGITNFRFHDLRHTAASHMIMAGVPFKTVGEIPDHKTATMTERYSHLTTEHKRNAVERLSACFISATFSEAKEKGAGE